MSEIKRWIDVWMDGWMDGYDGLRLATHLCFLINLLLVYSFVPDSFMSCAIVPLVKCKAGDLTDINNYRAITLSNAITKIMELVFVSHAFRQGGGALGAYAPPPQISKM